MGEFHGYVPPEAISEEKKPESKGLFGRLRGELAMYAAAGITTLAATTAEAKPRHQEHGKQPVAAHVHKEKKSHGHHEENKKVIKRTDATLKAKDDHGIDIEAAEVEKRDLTRFEDQEQLLRAIKQGIVQHVNDSGTGYTVDDKIGGHASKNEFAYQYARPYTKKFIEDLGKAYAAAGGVTFEVSSLVRTKRYQELLRKTKNSAVGAVSKTSHVTGTSFDIEKSSVEGKMRNWLRALLLDLERQGLIQATEEKHAFHVAVWSEYSNQVEVVAKEARENKVRHAKEMAAKKSAKKDKYKKRA